MRKLRVKNKRIRRRKKKKGTNEWFVLLILFFFIVIGIEFYEFINSNFPLQSLEIKCSNINSEDVKKSVELKPGNNLFKTGLKKIVSKLSEDSRIKDVHIFRNLPEGKIEIEVSERTPFVKVLKSGTDRCLEVDDSGVIIREADIISNDVPLITGLSINYSSSVPEVNEIKILKEAIEILKAGNSFNIPVEEISEVNLKDPNDMIFFTTYGTEIHLGNEDLYKRLEMAGTVLSEIKKKGIPIKYVDLRFGKEAITKM